MAKYKRFAGKYNPNTQYEAGDIVSFDGAAYYRKVPGKGVSPLTNAEFTVWSRLSEELSTVLGLDGLGGGVSREEFDKLSEEMANQTRALDGMTIEGYSRTGEFVNVIDSAVKHEDAYLRMSYVAGIGNSTAESVVSGWNWYELPVTEGEVYHLLTFCGMQPAACYMLDANRKLVQMLPDPVPSEGVDFDEEFTIPEGVTILQVNQQYKSKPFAFEKNVYGWLCVYQEQ